MKKTALLSLIIFISTTSVGFGYYLGNSNFDYGSYPSFKTKSFRPSKPYIRDSYSMEKYRSDMKAYLDDAQRYVTAANNDIEAIEDEISYAKKEADAAVREYNDFIKYGY